MCGIVFSYRPDVSPHVLEHAIEHARNLMAHRGPDHFGQKVVAPWGLGHQRLSIIDPGHSNQPISDPAERYFLSYNGELYNYRELRTHLEDRWTFRTAGDAEVVLAGLCRYGVEFLKLMEGMWALALWDQEDRTLLLVRDRMGKKPLYFCGDSNAFACASELRPLQIVSGFKWTEDNNSIADYFRFGFYLPGTTAYRNINEVLPAHWLKWSPGRDWEMKPYWRLSLDGFNGTRENASKMIKEIVMDSVRLRMVADVEVGALLSGGIDSSLVVSAMSRQVKHPVSTFTIGFHEAEMDERRYARALAGHLRTNHHECVMTWEDCKELADRVLVRTAQPFGDASLLPAAMVSRLAAQHLKVVLSGDGGDELFGGYNRYLARSCLRWITRLPEQVKGQLPALTKFLSNIGVNGEHLKFIFRLRDMIQRMEDEIPYTAPLNYNRIELQHLLPDHWRRGHRAPMLPNKTDVDDIRQMMIADALIYLPQDILSKMDRAGMAYSLEVRSPFLDRRVVELAFSLPRHWHRSGLKGKRMLQSAFGAMVPDWIWQRPKRGFALPLDDWFRNGLQTRLLALLMETQHPLRKSTVEKMVEMHGSRRLNLGVRLWQIYIYLRWLDQRPFRYMEIGSKWGY